MCLLNSLHTSKLKRSVVFALQTGQTCLGGAEVTRAAISAPFALGVQMHRDHCCFWVFSPKLG